MIVTDTLATRVDADLLMVETPGFADAVFRQLSREVIANAQGFGYLAGDGSTWMSRGTVKAGAFTVPFVCYWCPDPTLGVEFRGGPNDGKVLPLPRGDDGRPHERYRLPPEFSPLTAADFREPELHPRPMVIGEYQRLGIDSAFDRWVYQATN